MSPRNPVLATLEMKVGIFAAVALGVIAYATLRVSDRGIFRGGSYVVTVFIDSAEGLSKKTPVEVAGIQVGSIEDLELREGRLAQAKLRINREVRLGKDARAQVRTKGFLGETYVDLMPGHPGSGMIPEGGEITATNPYVDLGQIASDMREVTDSLKRLLSDREDAPLGRVLQNMEQFTKKMSEMTVQNQESVNQIVANLNRFSSDLSGVMAEKKETLKETMERMNSISRKVDEGRGTLGRLINDTETGDSINEAAKGLNETLGGINRFQTELSYHVEYLGASKDFKNYTGVALRPRPDKAFLLDFVVDPNPSSNETLKTTSITTGGVTTTVVTDENVIEKDKFLVSAQLAKSFYNFTLRGGIIESRGGIGLDYNVGPVGVQFSAFDFRTDSNQRPHLKVSGNLNVTKNLFLVTGVDDFISRNQNPDWFFGGGLRLVDNDLRSLFGVASLKK